MKHSLSLMAICAVLATPVAAEQPFKVPVTGDILPGWVMSDGSRMAAVRITLEPGWKTYWRAPGDAGIPPRFDWSRSRNLETVAISWPAPKVFDQNGMRSVGYEDTLVIPLHIKAKEPDTAVRLRVTLDMGVCADVCIPHQMKLDATLDTTTAS
ncbi:MAG: protein-disulfide reductase DsbD domain-containing protein, partial [Roseobacter sp.]|nr:protein-disulfide reductase DsbD domain-containing protein [Roseobacter sp.]